ncbi:MAG: tripartite tricarboxylate transporter substrate binding protein [Pigmentiphaga sp.]|uniref:Bug family tripartite tricarboxylate transporter substrate binding protein n=1 Tax=Pigmentiphaga sp. TaxID=1977564 RepID=UPI0029B63254|nr:tripartite tricarboxylate transporter substrate binding protein [Pigmentiphaga sp.]MDX3906196.1 tripartite tricarboxylate transporter substrate binding protein [Pigmentiphaga sp.]
MKAFIRYFAGMLACAAAVAASAQAYPQRPVRVIVPYPPGGTVDAVARVFADSLSQQLGQTFVVENRAGASGSIGSEAVARAPADGYTLLVNASTFAASPLLLKALPYDIHKDFTPITNLGEVPLLITANPGVPAKDLREFIALARQAPGKYFFGASAAGSASHLAEAAISYEAKADIPIVLYKGTGPALTDLMGGHISAVIDAVPSSLPPVKAGRTKALAVTSAQRLLSLPEVPTVAESGLPGFEMVSWYGLWGPAGLPADIVRTLHAAVVTAIESPRVKQTLNEQAFVGKGSAPEAFAAYVRAENARYAKLIKNADIRID